MTVAELRDRMGEGEFRHWAIHYARKAQRAELEELKARTAATRG